MCSRRPKAKKAVAKRKKIEGADTHTYARTLDYTANRETEKEGSRRDSLGTRDETRAQE